MVSSLLGFIISLMGRPRIIVFIKVLTVRNYRQHCLERTAYYYLSHLKLLPSFCNSSASINLSGIEKTSLTYITAIFLRGRLKEENHDLFNQKSILVQLTCSRIHLALRLMGIYQREAHPMDLLNINFIFISDFKKRVDTIQRAAQEIISFQRNLCHAGARTFTSKLAEEKEIF